MFAYDMSWHGFSWFILFVVHPASWVYRFTSFPHRGVSCRSVSEYFPATPSLSFPFQTLTPRAGSPVTAPLAPGLVRAVSSVAVTIVSVALSLSSLTPSSVLSIMLLNPSVQLLHFSVLKISIWLFCISSMSLLRFSLFSLVSGSLGLTGLPACPVRWGLMGLRAGPGFCQRLWPS